MHLQRKLPKQHLDRYYDLGSRLAFYHDCAAVLFSTDRIAGWCWLLTVTNTLRSSSPDSIITDNWVICSSYTKLSRFRNARLHMFFCLAPTRLLHLFPMHRPRLAELWNARVCTSTSANTGLSSIRLDLVLGLVPIACSSYGYGVNLSILILKDQGIIAAERICWSMCRFCFFFQQNSVGMYCQLVALWGRMFIASAASSMKSVVRPGCSKPFCQLHGTQWSEYVRLAWLANGNRPF